MTCVASTRSYAFLASGNNLHNIGLVVILLLDASVYWGSSDNDPTPQYLAPGFSTTWALEDGVTPDRLHIGLPWEWPAAIPVTENPVSLEVTHFQ